MLDKYVKSNTIFLNLDVQNREELFHKISKELRKEGYIKEGFEEFIQDREDKFPTGLKLENDNVAIPHGDAKFIKNPFVAIVTLLNPIQQKSMEDNEKLDIDVLFFLGLDGNNHLKLLQNVIALIQKDGFLENIRHSNSKDRILQIINEGENNNVKN